MTVEALEHSGMTLLSWHETIKGWTQAPKQTKTEKNAW